MRIKNIFNRESKKLFSNAVYLDEEDKKFYFLVQDKDSRKFRLVDMKDGFIMEEQYSTFGDISDSRSLSLIDAVLDVE